MSYCLVCDRPIVIQIFKETGTCCDICNKIWNGELTTEKTLEWLQQFSPDAMTTWEKENGAPVR